MMAGCTFPIWPTQGVRLGPGAVITNSGCKPPHLATFLKFCHYAVIKQGSATLPSHWQQLEFACFVTGMLENICSGCWNRPVMGNSKRPKATEIQPNNMIIIEIIRTSETGSSSHELQQHTVGIWCKMAHIAIMMTRTLSINILVEPHWWCTPLPFIRLPP